MKRNKKALKPFGLRANNKMKTNERETRMFRHSIGAWKIYRKAFKA
jgi:hypothetical protein